MTRYNIITFNKFPSIPLNELRYKLSVANVAIPKTDPKIEIIDEQNNDEPFARYSKGNVYIGNKEYINKIIKKININDVVI